MQKKKRMEVLIFALYDDGALILTFYFNVTFLLSYFCVTKRRVQGGEATSERRRRDGVYQKSARRTHAVLLANHRGVHELVARAMRGKLVQQMIKN